MASESSDEAKCAGCGDAFIARTTRQKYHSRDCQRRSSRNTSRTTVRLAHDLVFVGVDGEGVDRPNGDHEYIMLSVGDKTLTNPDGSLLALKQIFTFLWECYLDDPTACYVGFFLGYDFVQWEKLLPQRQAFLLLNTAGIAERTSQRKTRLRPHPDPVVWEGWEFDVMAGRRWKLRPHTHRRSRYNDRCTNRTCRAPIEGVLDGDIASVIRGEMAFVPPGDHDVEHEPWTGTTTQFWRHMSGVLSPTRRDAERGTLYVCDTGPFWQTTFLNVINPESWEGVDPVCTPDEFATIMRGKHSRGVTADYGDTWYQDEMREYNVLENAILSRVTTRLNHGFTESDIPIRIRRTDWYGPGRAAQAWMDMLHARVADRDAVSYNRSQPEKRVNERGLLNADVYMSMPAWFVDAARSSYYGGWFELFMHGHIGNAWEYDVNSAYPHVIATLPCLHTDGGHDGQYQRGTDQSFELLPESNRTLVYGTFTGSDPFIGCLPHRTRQGNILRPHVTEGWYWWHEVQASIRAGLIDSYDVIEWVSYTPCSCTPPFDPPDMGITRLYSHRLSVGKNTPQGKAAKLVYNSAYGKTAQSVGSPKYANPVYASLITAGCRTLILDAIASHPLQSSGVAMVATDGVYFTTPHPALTLDKTKLGAWDVSSKTNLTLFMPGVYWDDTTRERINQGDSPRLKSRGINAKDLADQIGLLDELFAVEHSRLRNSGQWEWPALRINVRFQLISGKAALNRGDWSLAGRVEHNVTRAISSNPSSKRCEMPYRQSGDGITRSHVYEQGASLATTAYSKSFGYLGESDGFFDGISPDGIDPLLFWSQALR